MEAEICDKIKSLEKIETKVTELEIKMKNNDK